MGFSGFSRYLAKRAESPMASSTMGPDRAKTMSAMMAALLLFFACVARSASACEGGTVADMLDEAIAEGIPFLYSQRALEEDPGLRAAAAQTVAAS